MTKVYFLRKLIQVILFPKTHVKHILNDVGHTDQTDLNAFCPPYKIDDLARINNCLVLTLKLYYVTSG